MPKTTGDHAPHSEDQLNARNVDSFTRFRQVARTHPEKLRNIPALAQELGIGQSTAYRYRQRLAHVPADEDTVRSSPATLPPAQPAHAPPEPPVGDHPRPEPAEQDQQPASTGAPNEAGAKPGEESPHAAQAAAQLTPEEVDQEIAKVLLMARRIRALRRARKDITDTAIADQLGIAVADIATTLRFEEGYLELERRLKQRQKPRDSGERRDRT